MPSRLAALAVVGTALVCAHGAGGHDGQVPPSLVFGRNSDLFRVTLDGAEVVRLTGTKARELSPAVSPDRRLIAYARGRDELWLMNADGTEQRKLVGARPRTVLGASTGVPSWTPAGRALYFHRWSEGCSWIYRIGVSGRGLKRVTDGTSHSEPAVSPDGSRIALSSSPYCDPGWYGRLAVVDPTGRPTNDLRKLGRIRGAEGAAEGAPSWAPDERRIAFMVWDLLDLEWRAVYVVNRDGSGLRQLTPRSLEAGSPAWSPDGLWIAFSGSGGLYVVRPDGSGLHRVPGTAAGDGGPAWLLRS